MTAIVCVAHPDDEALSLGGTIAKLSAREDVFLVVFSYGDKWPPWREKSGLIRERLSETLSAGRVLGVKKTYFLGFRDMQLKKAGLLVDELLERIFLKHKPDKVFYHSPEDGHVDHRAVSSCVSRVIKSLGIKVDEFIFEGVLFTLTPGKPYIVFDISKTINAKIKALTDFKSQKLIIYPLIPIVLLKAFYHGRRNGFGYGEVFFTK